MNLFKASVLTFILAFLQTSHGLQPEEGLTADAALAPTGIEERNVQLRLEDMDVSTVFLAANSTTVFSTMNGPTVLEVFKVEVELLSKKTLELLKAGGTLTATVVPIAPFHIRSESSLDIVDVSHAEVTRRLLHGDTLAMPPTLCGAALARGRVSLSLDHNDKNQSSMAMNIYYRVDEKHDQDSHLQSRRLAVGTCDTTILAGGAETCTFPEDKCTVTCERKLYAFDYCEQCHFFKRIQTIDYPGKCTTKQPSFGKPLQCDCILNDENKARKERWEKEFVPPPQPQCPPKPNRQLGQDERQLCHAAGHGDPHFATWDGQRYSYHGQCDLVLAESVSFRKELGLHVHIRTTLGGTWSYIANAAIKLGSDVLEVFEDGTHYFNGNHTEPLPGNISGIELTKEQKPTCGPSSDGEETASCPTRTVYKINLGLDEQIFITAFKGLIRVQVNAFLPDVVGMMGTLGKPGLIARDGFTVLEPKEMGPEWQVRPDLQPVLFHEARAPQYPVPCVRPHERLATGRGLRLQENTAMRRLAVEACADVFDSDIKAECLFDVEQMGDVDMALPYLFGEADAE